MSIILTVYVMVRSLKYVLFACIILAAVVFVVYSYAVSPTKAPTTAAVAGENTVPSDQGFRIVSEKTTASFSLNEVLRGEPVLVVGTTNQVSGEVMADRADLTGLSIKTIRVNARTFVTDSEQRNNAIRRLILKTEDDANEFIQFVTKTVTGLPQTAEIGTPFSFQATGDLTVSGMTREVTFAVTAMFASEQEITGSAETLLHYPDFEISIPDFPFLANVDQDVTLKIQFVAQR